MSRNGVCRNKCTGSNRVEVCVFFLGHVCLLSIGILFVFFSGCCPTIHCLLGV